MKKALSLFLAFALLAALWTYLGPDGIPELFQPPIPEQQDKPLLLG
jgi:hypothetical protein